MVRPGMPDDSSGGEDQVSLRRHAVVARARLEAWFRGSAASLRKRLGDSASWRAAAVAIVPLALSPSLIVEARKELASPLFRDAAQCQYSGWCILHGLKLYRDVGAPDGPLIHFLHAFLQIIAGNNTDAGCRRADLAFQIFCSGAMGVAFAPRVEGSRLGGLLTRAAWALLAAALWLAWYFAQGWDQTVQRDAYFGLLGYLGLVLVYTSANHRPKPARWTAGLGGWLCVLLLFSRHSGIIYPASAVLALVLADDPLREMRTARLRAAATGAIAALATVFVLLLAFGSVAGLWFWYFRFPFVFYAWLARQSPVYLFTEVYREAAQTGFLALAGVIVAVVVKLLPRRALGFAFAPLLFVVAAALVGKGWVNHVQQTTMAPVILGLLCLSELWKFEALAPRWTRLHAGAAALSLIVAGQVAINKIHSSWYLTAEVPQAPEPDIVDAEIVGDFLKRRTNPRDRIFLYGHEAHVLLNAERGPAVASYVNHSLNIELFYERAPAAPQQGPNRRQRRAITKLQHDIARDACSRLRSHPPGAMVFLDNSLGTFLDARAEVKALCPDVPKLLAARYHEVTVPKVSDYHVYLRR
jgi:hypothetical protein